MEINESKGRDEIASHHNRAPQTHCRDAATRGHGVGGVISRHDLVNLIARADGNLEAGPRRMFEVEGMRRSSLEVGVRDDVPVLAEGRDGGTMQPAEIPSRLVPVALDVQIWAEPA